MPIKEGALIDFLRTYPSMVARACPTESIADGFILNRMIDKRSLSHLDITKILQTCKKNSSVNTYQSIIYDNFVQLYNEVSNKGHLSDEFLLSVGIGADVN